MSLRLERVLTDAAFERLEQPWNDLVRSLHRPSPFALHGWLFEWWKHRGRRRELAVQVAWRNDALVAALPTCIHNRYGARVLEFVGGTQAPLVDLLLAPGEGVYTAEAMMARVGDYDFADLFGLPRASRLVSACRPGSFRVIQRLEAPVLDLSAGWEATYHAKFSSHGRTERRRHLRRLEQVGPVEILKVKDGTLLGEAFALHALRWRGRRDTSEFSTPADQAFYRDALARLAKDGVPRLVLIRVGGKAIAFTLDFVLDDVAYGVTTGFDPEWARFSPGTEALLQALEWSASEGVRRVEFLGAAETYKARYTDELNPLCEAIGLPGTIRGRVTVEALVGGVRARRRLKQWQFAHDVYRRTPRLTKG